MCCNGFCSVAIAKSSIVICFEVLSHNYNTQKPARKCERDNQNTCKSLCKLMLAFKYEGVASVSCWLCINSCQESIIKTLVFSPDSCLLLYFNTKLLHFHICKMSQATTYSKMSQLQTEDGLELLSKLSPQEGMTILDMGCGTGYLSSVLADHVGPSGSVLAVDPDLERLMLAKESYGDIPNLKFVEGSTDDFPSEEQQFDVVFSNYVLHWVSDKEGAFKRIYKSLKSGGKFGFRTVVKHNSIYFDQMLNLMDAKRRHNTYSKMNYTPVECYQTAANSSNFLVTYKNSFTSDFGFENINAAMDFWFAVTHGGFDPRLADKEELEKFKQKFGNSFVTFEPSDFLFMVLQKQ